MLRGNESARMTGEFCCTRTWSSGPRCANCIHVAAGRELGVLWRRLCRLPVTPLPHHRGHEKALQLPRTDAEAAGLCTGSLVSTGMDKDCFQEHLNLKCT